MIRSLERAFTALACLLPLLEKRPGANGIIGAAPSKTLRDVLTRIETEVKADFAAFVRSETKAYAERVRITGIKGDQ